MHNINEVRGEMFLFNFKNPEETLKWVSLDDRVMGGASRSRLDYSGENAAFKGEVRLVENRPGFASVRSKNSSIDLKAFEGLSVRVRGDGKVYRLNIKTDRHHDGFLYQYAFKTEEGEWMDIAVPFENFRPSFRGRAAKDARPPDAGKIMSLGLMISGQEGKFVLEIEHIKAYRK
ncbi:CIA30 family protein [Methanosarcina sp. KYL-1]|uniref:CIA30 family protein n=1 Tax=Methanosarcina sp. KYL-1 TaxID=2602068 RepID=UPI002100EB00|nr:CIA30 family protein [Methanosarcina sp. KYL-1]MCQ1534908.1 CIA30 family protein [Methanosarcina sp. KYL-1]